MASHIEHAFEHYGAPPKVAKARAWATVNKRTGGAEANKKQAASSMKSQAKTGSGRKPKASTSHAQKGRPRKK